MIAGVKINSLLKSLDPTNHEEIELLKTLIRCAQKMLRGAQIDLSLSPSDLETIRESPLPNLEMDTKRFIELIPNESKRYLHSLIEALEIYHSIKGVSLAPRSIQLGSGPVDELRQIRDLCLQDGVRTIY